MNIRETITRRAERLHGFPGQTLPEATPELLQRAEQIASGTIFFYGRTPVEIGLRNIEWRGDHIAHQEWPAQLNRFPYLAPLAAAYRETADDRFPQAARSYIEDWIAYHPGYEAATEFRPGDSGLNMAGRLGSSHGSGWTGCLPALVASAAFDDSFLDSVIASIASQSAFLSHHLTAWGNWRIAELDALIFTALRLPFLPNADELLRIGITGMRNALATQFLPDGVHIERTPGYHHWMAEVAASYYRLARRFPEADVHMDPDMLVRAFDYGAQSELFPVNDGYSRHREPDRLRYLAARTALLDDLPPGRRPDPAPPLEQVFPHAGQVFSRSSWQPGADLLAFDASTWGGGHCHLSRLSFIFRSGGRELVSDPGILSYEMSDPLGPYGKSTAAHTTLSPNGANQTEASAVLLRTEFTPDTALIHARYEGGYCEGEYGWSFAKGHGPSLFGLHERILWWVKGEYLLALDFIDTDSGSVIHSSWQLGPMDAWDADASTLSWCSGNSDTNLFLQLAFPSENAEMECFEGSREPLRGWIGLHGNDAMPAPLVEFRYPAGRPGGSPSAVLLVPFSGPERPAYSVRRTAQSAWGRLHELELALPDGSTDLVCWTKGLSSPVETEAGLTTDAPFAWLRLDAGGTPVKAFLLDGSHLEHARRTLHEARVRTAALLGLAAES